VSALVLTAILVTAAAASLLWWRTAEGISRELASTINEQIVAAVRKEVSAIVDEARAAHTAIRTLFLQNVLDTREADKREFVFLSQLQSQGTISWVAFGMRRTWRPTCWTSSAASSRARGEDSNVLTYSRERHRSCNKPSPLEIAQQC
jgi:hypothetical protein